MYWTDYRQDAPPDSGEWAASDRGWLWKNAARQGTALGTYLDYGPEHYRSGDSVPTLGGGTYRYRPAGAACACSHQWQCRDCQPGNVLAVVYQPTRAYRYCETVAAARQWIQQLAAGAGAGAAES